MPFHVPPRSTRRPQSPSQQSSVHSHKFPTMSDRPAAFEPSRPTPPRSAADTSCPSSGSATTHTPARRPSSRTSQDADPSAKTRGSATSRRYPACHIPRPRDRRSPTRTPDTPSPSPRSGPSPDCRPQAPPSPDTRRSPETLPRVGAPHRRRPRGPRPEPLRQRPENRQHPPTPLVGSTASATPPAAPAPAHRIPRSGTAADTPRTPQGSCCP